MLTDADLPRGRYFALVGYNWISLPRFTGTGFHFNAHIANHRFSLRNYLNGDHRVRRTRNGHKGPTIKM